MSAPVLLLPLLMDYDTASWLGGKIYLRNVLSCLSALPEGERPDVFLLQPHGGSEAFIADIRPLPCVAGVLDGRGLPKDLRDDILVEVMPEGRFSLERMQAILDRVVATFPAPSPSTEAGGDYPHPVLWIPDFQHHRLPHLFTAKVAEARTAKFQHTAQSEGDLLILSSRDALADFRQFYPEAKVDVAVWPFASALDATARDFADPRAELGLPKTFFYTPNQFWVHKDFETAIRALGLLKARGVTPHLVISGPTEDFRQPNHYPDMMALARELGVADQIHHVGTLPRDRQVDLFRAAAAILQPSLFEGWSTVIEDARAVGRPLVLSDIPIHREQVPEGGHFFTAKDPSALADLWERLHPLLPAGPDPAVEAKAAAATNRRLEDRGRALLALLTAHALKRRMGAPGASIDWAGTPTEDGPNVLRVAEGTHQWYGPVFASAASVAARHWSGDYPALAREFGARTPSDDYVDFMTRYMAEGLARFGSDWRFADIVSVLLCLTDHLAPKDYLEIGVRRGRGARAVGWRAPEVSMVLRDMWQGQTYAGMEVPGPDSTRAALTEMGHEGAIEVLEGDSHELLPQWLAANPTRRFDLITVDGDHSTEGAVADLRAVLPRLRLGGAVIFDDIAHPLLPEVSAVWRALVAEDRRFSTWSHRDLGYGVGFAIRRA